MTWYPFRPTVIRSAEPLQPAWNSVFETPKYFNQRTMDNWSLPAGALAVVVYTVPKGMMMFIDEVDFALYNPLLADYRFSSYVYDADGSAEKPIVTGNCFSDGVTPSSCNLIASYPFGLWMDEGQYVQINKSLAGQAMRFTAHGWEINKSSAGFH